MTDIAFDIKYIDLHSVHGTNSIICSLVLNNGMVIVGQSHNEISSTKGALLARKDADVKLVLTQVYSESTKHKEAQNG